MNLSCGTFQGVLRAVVGEDRSRTALHAREEEVLTFVRNALRPRGDEALREAVRVQPAPPKAVFGSA